MQFQYDMRPSINTGSGLFLLTAIIFDPLFSRHVSSGHNKAKIAVVSLSTANAVLCLLLGVHIVFTRLILDLYFAMCFGTFKKDTFYHMQFAYSQSCILPEFFGANLMIIIGAKDFRAQILQTLIRIVALATIAMIKLVFYFGKSCSSSLVSVVLRFAYKCQRIIMVNFIAFLLFAVNLLII